MTKTIFVRNMPPPLHARFKVICALRGQTMQNQFLRLVEEFVRREEKRTAKKVNNVHPGPVT